MTRPVPKRPEHYEFLQRSGLPDHWPIWKNRKGQEFIMAGARKETVDGKYKWFAHVFFVKGGYQKVPFEKMAEYEKMQSAHMVAIAKSKRK